MITSATSLTLDSDPEKLRDLQPSLYARCRGAGLDDSAAHEFTQAIVEALNNIIKHGYLAKPGYPITLHWRCGDDSIQIEIRDRARPPPAGYLKDPVKPLPESEGGFGQYIITEYTDSAHIARDGDENVLYLTRRR